MGTDFAESLKRCAVTIDLRGETKEAIIREMIDMLAGAGLIEDVESIFQSVMEREMSMSTGMQHGVAVPHGKTDAVESMVSAIAIKKEGVDFDSIDGKPCQFFVMTISPRLISGPHVRFLGHIGMLLESPKLRERLLDAKSAAEVVDMLLN